MFPKYFKKNILFFSLILLILNLLSVAFFTLMERKIMSVNQFRLGPNKIFFLGFLQPVFDGFKLFLKMMNNNKKNNFFFFFSPFISFFMSCLFWSFLLIESFFLKNMMFLFFLGVTVYSLVLSGWASFSKFGYLGGIRASSQTVSYEIIISLIILSITFFFMNFFFLVKKELLIFFFFFPIFILWFFSLIAETNRAPLDFSEGESELISGFNIEYGSSGFVLFFLSEYSIMIFFSFITFFFFNLMFFFFF